MGELRYPDVELDGPAREAVLQRCLEQIHHWQVPVPMAFVLVLNFGLDEFERTGLTEFFLGGQRNRGGLLR